MGRRSKKGGGLNNEFAGDGGARSHFKYKKHSIGDDTVCDAIIGKVRERTEALRLEVRQQIDLSLFGILSELPLQNRVRAKGHHVHCGHLSGKAASAANAIQMNRTIGASSDHNGAGSGRSA